MYTTTSCLQISHVSSIYERVSSLKALNAHVTKAKHVINLLIFLDPRSHCVFHLSLTHGRIMISSLFEIWFQHRKEYIQLGKRHLIYCSWIRVNERKCEKTRRLSLLSTIAATRNRIDTIAATRNRIDTSYIICLLIIG